MSVVLDSARVSSSTLEHIFNLLKEGYKVMHFEKVEGELHPVICAYEVTFKDLPLRGFQPYRKTKLILARELTLEDYQVKGGLMLSCDGFVRFEPGDFEAIDHDGRKWLMRAASMATHMMPAKVHESSNDGWHYYQYRDVYWGIRMEEPFSVETKEGRILYGPAFDFLVIGPNGNPEIVQGGVFHRELEKVRD